MTKKTQSQDLFDGEEFHLFIQTAPDPMHDVREEMARRQAEADRKNAENNQFDWLRHDDRNIRAAIAGRNTTRR